MLYKYVVIDDYKIFSQYPYKSPIATRVDMFCDNAIILKV